MSKVYDWWVSQVCLRCGNTNEECQCLDDFPTEPGDIYYD